MAIKINKSIVKFKKIIEKLANVFVHAMTSTKTKR